MTRTFYDGINTDAAKIPLGAAGVGGYVDGLYKWSPEDWARFPHAVKVRIAVFSTTNDGHVLDCEPGNATPPESVNWVLMRRRAGADPTVYCGRNTWWGQIRAAFKARGVPEPHYWVADYSGDPARPVIPAGAIALQYADTGGYDLSIAPDYWPGVDPAPDPAPVPEPSSAQSQETDMLIHLIKGSPAIWGLSGGLYWLIHDVESLAGYRAAGVKEVTITAAEHQNILDAVAARLPTAGATIPVTLSGTGQLSVQTQTKPTP